jgi:GT2 family glycosyltransferase
MKFSLIVCTYMRPKPLLSLLNSVTNQTLYPNEILIIDGSTNNETETLLKENKFEKLSYFKVEENKRGLTKQRNFGIEKVSNDIDVVCFLDDDTELTKTYFEELISTYNIKPDALAVGGYITNEVNWEPTISPKQNNKFYFDDWMRSEPLRFRVRRWFDLLPDAQPGFFSSFSHGRSVSFLPPSRKIYEVEQIMGGVSSYKKSVFKTIKFSSYFEGYGLYEDADFSLRLAKIGNLYVNTKAQLEHHHEASGRPNKFKYGKMVIINGWYVWRVKYPNPSINERFKWNEISFLLTLIRFSNVFNTNQRKEAFSESLGRVMGWLSLVFNKPSIQQ